MTGAVVWFVLFEVMLFVCGLSIAALEEALANQLPKSIGWRLLVIAIAGVVLMPDSGFWLVFPPTVAVLLKKPLAKLDVTEI